MKATPEMISAGAEAARKYMEETGGNNPAVIWDAMWAVRPQQQEPVEKVPGMAVQALAGEIVEALLADEKDEGYDLTAGLFGPKFSALVRRWAAAEWNTSPPASKPWVGLTDEELKRMWVEYRAAIPRYLCFARAVEAKLREKNRG